MYFVIAAQTDRRTPVSEKRGPLVRATVELKEGRKQF